MTEIVLRFSLPPAGLRRNHEANRYRANALKDAYSNTMLAEYVFKGYARDYGHPRHTHDFDAEIIWQQTGEGDTDNCLSNVKNLLDNLGCAPVTQAGCNRIYLGVYESDSQIKRICVERERVSKKAEEGVTIVLRERA